MNTCPNCGAQIADDALFCTECGNQIPQGNACPNCGAEAADNGTKFCAKCGNERKGTENFCSQCGTPFGASPIPGNNKETKKSPKQGVIIASIVCLLMLAAGGAAWYFFATQYVDGNGESAFDYQETETTSEESIKNRINEIGQYALNNPEEEVVEKYFSSDFKRLYNQLSEYYDNGIMDGLWYSGDFWSGSSESSPQIITAGKIKEMSNNKIIADMIVGTEGYKHAETVILVLENGTWVIDDIGGHKAELIECIEYCENLSDNDSNPYIGKTYEGSGYGGGLYTEMTITFLDNNNCRCISDWYQAYPGGKTLNGTYEVENGHIFVHCAYDGINYDFDFDVSDNGRSIGFDKSDPEESGTIGINIMGLELVE